MSKQYEDFLAEKRTWYKAVVKSHCPILQEDVHFTSKGFQHLLYDGLGHGRSRKERIYRLGLLPLVIPVLKNATRIYGVQGARIFKDTEQAGRVLGIEDDGW